MKKYFKVFLALISLSSKRYLENRMDTFGTLTSSVVLLAIYIIFIEALFQFTGQLNNWTKPQLFFFVGLSRISLSIFSLLVLRSINRLPEYIRRGDLDLILTKPVDSQFYTSFRLTRPYEIFSVISGFILCWYAVGQLNQEFSLFSFMILGLGLLLGLVILYGLYFALATLGFWLGNLNSLSNIYWIITRPLNLPTNIYGSVFTFILTFVLPLGFIITVPMELFLGITPLLFLGLGLILATSFLGFSVWFWRFALKHYTSASS